MTVQFNIKRKLIIYTKKHNKPMKTISENYKNVKPKYIQRSFVGSLLKFQYQKQLYFEL